MQGIIKLPNPWPRGAGVTAEIFAKAFGGKTKPARKDGKRREGHTRFTVTSSKKKFELDVPDKHWEKLNIAGRKNAARIRAQQD